MRRYNKYKIKKKVKRFRGINILRNATVLIFVSFIAIWVVGIYISGFNKITVFPIKNIIFSGNKHLSKDELIMLTDIHGYESLITISNKKIAKMLLKSPWIRSVIVRKEFPDTIVLEIKEAVPFAILDMNGHLFLVDENGKLLEEMSNESIPFLPVITGDPFKEREAFLNALKLAKTMSNKGFSLEWDYIEIIIDKPQELKLLVDGTLVKIGAGMYKEKLERLIKLKDVIKNSGILVDYIDLRFRNKAIVKPIKDERIFKGERLS